MKYFNIVKNKITDKEPLDINQQLVISLNKKRIPNWSQIKQLPKFLNKGEKLQLIIALSILLISFTVLITKSYINNSISVAAKGGEYTEGIIGTPELINPILANTDADRDLVKLIFSGLMKLNEQGELIPDLAQGYEINAEKTVYTFELRDDLKWHDDYPLTADDIIFTIDSIKDVEYKSPLKNSFNGISVHKINDKTVQFELQQPFAPFLSILTVGIIPEHIWHSVPPFGASLSKFSKKPIGSGPFKFSSLIRDENGIIKNYTLESYENYHLNEPYIHKLNFKFYPDFLTGATALQNKNIEGLMLLPKQYKEEIKNDDIVFHNFNYPQYSAVFFNPNNNEILSDNNFRKVLALAVDKQRILTEVVNNDGQIINSPILPGLEGYSEETQSIEHSLEQAKEILEEMKWVISADGEFRTKGEGEDEKELIIKLTTIDQSDNVKIVSIIQENWQSIGIKTELEIIAKDKIKKDIIESRNYEALVFGQVININSGPYPFWHSEENTHPGLNLSILANKDIDNNLEIIQTTQDNNKKLIALKEFQERLTELNFAIFLYTPTYTYPVEKKVKGIDNIKFINLPSDRFNNINSWYIKTKRVLTK